MLRSLVGSEMCIRDSCCVCRHNRCLVCRHITLWKCHNLVLPDLAPQKWKSVTIWTYREISQRKSQEWHSLGEADPALVAPGLGDTTFPWEARVCGVPVPKKYWPLFQGWGWGGGWDLQKMRPDPGFRKDFPHYWALPDECQKDGVTGVAKIRLLGIWALGKFIAFSRIKTGGLSRIHIH